MTIDRKSFFDAVRKSPGGGLLRCDPVDGMTRILDEWEKRGLTNLDWLAYMLATVWHETGATMQPIKEYGRSHGKPTTPSSAAPIPTTC